MVLDKTLIDIKQGDQPFHLIFVIEYKYLQKIIYICSHMLTSCLILNTVHYDI